MNSITSAAEQDSVVEAAADTIGTLLQAAGKLKLQDLERVATLQKKHKLRFGEAAVKLGLVTEADIRQALSQQFEYPNFSVSQSGLGAELTAATDPYSEKAEALRSLRSELLLRWFRDGRKTLAIGSAHANEGSSYLAANLAVLFAQMGRKVLLVDANLRQPRQHELFGLGNGMGLSDILAGRVPSLQVHTLKPFHNLSVLSAGSPPPNPAELLGRPYFASLLAGLETSYDIILLDMAPSQASADFQAVSACAGGVVIATRRNVSSLVPLTALKEKIVLAGAQVVGAVVLD
jgi:chain length determinant protein tyrosine kinase EpsG